MTLLLLAIPLSLHAPPLTTRTYPRMMFGASSSPKPLAPSDWRRSLPNALTVGRVLAVPALAAAFYAPPSPSRPLWAPAALFALTSATDALDGFLARKWAAQSAFGAFLDPVADKLLVCTALVLLSGVLGPWLLLNLRPGRAAGRLSLYALRCATALLGAVALVALCVHLLSRRVLVLLATIAAAVAVPTALIVGREIFVSALREWMATLGCVDRVAVSAWGKLKTATQMVALLVLLVAQPSAAPVAIPKGASAVPHLRDGLVLLWIAAALAVASAADYALAAARVLRERSGSSGATPKPAPRSGKDAESRRKQGLL